MLLKSASSSFLQAAFEEIKSCDEKLSVSTWGGNHLPVNRALLSFFSPTIRNILKDLPKEGSIGSIILPDFQLASVEHLLNVLNSGVACFAVLKDVVDVAKALGVDIANIEYTDNRHINSITVKEEVDYDLNFKEEVSELDNYPVSQQLDHSTNNTEQIKETVEPAKQKIKEEVAEEVISSEGSSPNLADQQGTITEPLPVSVTDFLRGFRKTPRPLLPTISVPELTESFLRNHLPHSLSRLVITLEEKQEVYCLYEGLRHVEGKEKRAEYVPDIFFPEAIKDQLKMKRRMAFLTGKWLRWGPTPWDQSPGTSSPTVSSGQVSPTNSRRGKVSPSTTRPSSNSSRPSPTTRPSPASRPIRHRKVPGSRHPRGQIRRNKASLGKDSVPETTMLSHSSSSRSHRPAERRDLEYGRSRRETSSSRSGRERNRRSKTRSRSRLRR